VPTDVEIKVQTRKSCIDGNTKPLWSSNSCYKGKVTMLGRVMNCLENVFIHDGKGHPLYFQTFHGHVDLGKHALEMQTKLIQLLEKSSAHVQVNRILIMDGGGNGVKTLRALSETWKSAFLVTMFRMTRFSDAIDLFFITTKSDFQYMF
jgi:hypothetical protein